MPVSLSQKPEFNEWTEFGPVIFERLSGTPDAGCFQAPFVFFLLFRLDLVRVLSLCGTAKRKRKKLHPSRRTRISFSFCNFTSVFIGKHTRPAVKTLRPAAQVNHESFRHS